MEVGWNPDGSVVRKFPLKAFAAHLLSDLRSDALPRDGETVFLTIDARVQMATEKALRAVPRGCAVVVDPRTGDVLAMASVPSFDPGKADDPNLSSDETHPLNNRAAATYPPGALYLPVTLLAGISPGLDSFEHTCTGSRRFGDKVMRCWKNGEGGGHGPQILADGLKNSCNTFFCDLGVAVGPQKIVETAEVLGLGRPGGLPLKTEASGNTGGPNSPAVLGPGETWTDARTATMALGLGSLMVTPIQMASLAATLADGQAVCPLRLIDRVVKANGTTVRPEPPGRTSLEKLGLSRDKVRPVRAGLLASVNGAGGNAQKGRISGFSVGGRTGTAQFWRRGEKERVAAFLGFAESEDRSYAFSVFVEGAKSGGAVAAPLAARILSSIGEFGPAPLEPAKGSSVFVETLE